MNQWDFCAVGPLCENLRPFKGELKVQITSSSLFGMTERSYSTNKEISDFFKWIVDQGWEIACSGGVEISENAISSLMRGPGGGIQAHMLYFKKLRETESI